MATYSESRIQRLARTQSLKYFALAAAVAVVAAMVSCTTTLVVNHLTTSTRSESRDWIIVAAGQSNMSGGDIEPPDGLYPSDPRLQRYDRDADSLVPLTPRQGALYAGISRALLERAPSDVRIIVINAAAGASGFTSTSLNPPPSGYVTHKSGTWDRHLSADPLNRFDMMVADVLAVRDRLPEATVQGLFWAQGENDTWLLDGGEYAFALDDMVTAFREAISDPTLPVVIGSMLPEYVANNPKRLDVQYALMDTPRRLLNTAFVYGPVGMARTDQSPIIHFSNASSTERGRQMVEALDRARWNFASSAAIPPQNLKASRSGEVLAVTYDPPPTRHTSFAIEFSTDNGNSWLAMEKLGGEIGLSAVASVPTTDAVKIRASTTNELNTSGFVYVDA